MFRQTVRAGRCTPAKNNRRRVSQKRRVSGVIVVGVEVFNPHCKKSTRKIGKNILKINHQFFGVFLYKNCFHQFFSLQEVSWLGLEVCGVGELGVLDA